MFSQVSVHGGGGSESLSGGLCLGGSLSRGGLCPGALCQGGGLCPGVSVWGSLSREVAVQGGLCLGVYVSVRPPSDGNKRAGRIILECNLVKIEVLK